MQCLMTGSWDKTVKFWDGRSPNPVHTGQLPERLYCMDVKFPLCVIGTADRHIVIYDLRKPQVEFKVFFKYIYLSIHPSVIFRLSVFKRYSMQRSSLSNYSPYLLLSSTSCIYNSVSRLPSNTKAELFLHFLIKVGLLWDQLKEELQSTT